MPENHSQNENKRKQSLDNGHYISTGSIEAEGKMGSGTKSDEAPRALHERSASCQSAWKALPCITGSIEAEGKMGSGSKADKSSACFARAERFLPERLEGAACGDEIILPSGGLRRSVEIIALSD